MPYQRYPLIQQKMEIRSKALAANIEETPHLMAPLAKLDGLLAQVKDLTAEQARLTAARQEVSKQIAQIMEEAKGLMTYLDLGVKNQYGNRSEKLVEYGLKPFRSKRSVRRVGPDGKRLRGKAVAAEATATREDE